MTTLTAPPHHPTATAVADLMHPGVVSCRPDAPLAEVARSMVEHRIHAVVVDGGRDQPVWGIVTDLDLVGRLEAADTMEAAAATLAATPAIVVAPDAPVTEAARLMHDYDVHHLVVVSASRAPLGVISTLDIVAAMAA